MGLWGEEMFDPIVFSISRIILFFATTLMIYNAMQALDLGRIFQRNSANQIRFVFIVLSVILGYLFADAIVSLFELVNGMFV
jgi:uncharacterized membrane protein YwzB